MTYFLLRVFPYQRLNAYYHWSLNAVVIAKVRSDIHRLWTCVDLVWPRFIRETPIRRFDFRAKQKWSQEVNVDNWLCYSLVVVFPSFFSTNDFLSHVVLFLTVYLLLYALLKLNMWDHGSLCLPHFGHCILFCHL